MNMTYLVLHFLFYFYSAVLLLSGVMVIISRNTVRGVLFLVLAFIAAAAMWLLLQAEFLALVLIFVYVGAVMTLFLFVVMMLNVEIASQRRGFVSYLPFGVLVIFLLLGLMAIVILPKHFALAAGASPIMHAADYSNVKTLGQVLYTEYMYPFEIAAVLLLVGIVAAISLTFRGRQGNSKAQDLDKQISVRRKSRVRLVKM